jgi:cysteine desulfurase
MQKHAILLDSNAGAPLHPRVREALFAFLDHDHTRLGNPSSLHTFGRAAHDALESAKAAVLSTLKADAKEWDLVFTSGGTESNQWAVRGVLDSALSRFQAGERQTPPVWWVSPLEHACVLELIPEMEVRGVKIRTLELTRDGEILFPEATPSEKADLISMIGVNNETGLFQSFLRPNLTSHILSAEITSSQRTLFHTDYVAGWGKGDLDLSLPHGTPDLVAITAHKLGGLPGIGALIYRKSLRLSALIPGTQQGGHRGGTENLLGILSMRALAEHWQEIRNETNGLAALRDRFEEELLRRIPLARITGKSEQSRGEPTLERAPHLSHFVFPGLKRGYSLVQLLDVRGFALSSGSACASQASEPSHVLRAMGFNEWDALNSLRLSLHPGNTWDELEGLLQALEQISQRF